jgi:hypothetical protein
MVYFFFYNKLTNIELIKRINEKFEWIEGSIYIKNYSKEPHLLELDDIYIENNKIQLNGIIVNFNMCLEDIIFKINQIEECKLNKCKYSLSKVLAFNKLGGTFISYIIY